MNFIGWLEGPKTRMELKYCERCGGLWLRPQGDEGVDCCRCRARTADLLRPGKVRGTEPQIRQEEDLQSQGQIDYLQAVAEMEVRA